MLIRLRFGLTIDRADEGDIRLSDAEATRRKADSLEIVTGKGKTGYGKKDRD